MNSIDKVNKLSKSDFISIFGNVFEKTEWIAAKDVMIQNLIIILMNYF